MCGIAGIYNFSSKSQVDKSLVREMCDSMTHRGPDEEGFWFGTGIGLGHRRLSIIDLSSGQQPMSNEDDTIWVVFNGEIYNHNELDQELKKKGHRFKTKSDTETIIHLYEEKGEEFLKDLNGMFAIALWDGRKKRLVLARDRLGKKPLYYSLGDKRLIFASEMKAILCDSAIHREIDPVALSDYLSFLYVPAPKTILKGIQKLTPGTYLVVDCEGMRSGKFWELSCKTDRQITFSAGVDELRSLLYDSVRIRLESDVPLGAFLSGGIDSSTVVKIMSEMSDSPVSTTSIGFKESGYNELPYSRLLAENVRSEHHEYLLESDFIQYLPEIVWHLDEPFADSSALPTYLLCMMTRKNVTVSLSGDGGDENFAGYTWYGSADFENKFRFIPSLARMALLKPLLGMVPSYLRGANFLRNLTESSEKAIANKIFCYSEDWKNRLFSDSFRKKVADYTSVSTVEKYFSECDSDELVTRFQYVDLKTYLPEDILMKVDKMSMANSLEVRAPFLDYRLVEFVFSLPFRFKLSGGKGKYILKEMLSGYLPEDIISRKKSGFSVPIDIWFRGKLKGLMERILFDQRTLERGYFKPETVRWLWERYLSHPIYQTDISHHLWALFVFEIWNRIYIDGDRHTAL